MRPGHDYAGLSIFIALIMYDQTYDAEKQWTIARLKIWKKKKW